VQNIDDFNSGVLYSLAPFSC